MKTDMNLFLTIGKDLTNIWACLSIKVGSKQNVVVLARSPFVLRVHTSSKYIYVYLYST